MDYNYTVNSYLVSPGLRWALVLGSHVGTPGLNTCLKSDFCSHMPPPLICLKEDTGGRNLVSAFSWAFTSVTFAISCSAQIRQLPLHPEGLLHHASFNLPKPWAVTHWGHTGPTPSWHHVSPGRRPVRPEQQLFTWVHLYSFLLWPDNKFCIFATAPSSVASAQVIYIWSIQSEYTYSKVKGPCAGTENWEFQKLKNVSVMKSKWKESVYASDSSMKIIMPTLRITVKVSSYI